ncbi:unnamed protein product [Danaus chrysippus]|uniref:(African queen) hypothetical protein n=1 Tax=Danaus chrysippus TaxID=151541 RepID=A0A8J2QZB9_9NEOP|nr:unnamed protein product [Danaus chrysippus]
MSPANYYFIYTNRNGEKQKSRTAGRGRRASPQERRAAPSSEPRGPSLCTVRVCGSNGRKHNHWSCTVTMGYRTVVRAWLRVVVAVGWAMLSGGAEDARAGHGGLLLDTAVRPVRASAARAARHWAAHRPRPRPPPLRAHLRTIHRVHRDHTVDRPHNTTHAIYRLST